jgi:hypothetical protein
MSARHLFLRLTLYYLGVIGLALALGSLWPGFADFLPVGGAQGLLTEQSSNPLESRDIVASRVENLGTSILWLLCAVAGALATIFPVTWVYIACRDRKQYDQALVESMIIMPIAVTAIVLMVQNSLAMAFSLAGIVGAVRFRNSLKNTGDALFLLVAIAIGLSAGIGALEIAFVMTMVFNFTFLLLWVTDYGGIHGRRRYLRESHEEEPDTPDSEEEDEPPAAKPDPVS